jgi:hypothetical protein
MMATLLKLLGLLYLLLAKVFHLEPTTEHHKTPQHGTDVELFGYKLHVGKVILVLSGIAHRGFDYIR